RDEREWTICGTENDMAQRRATRFDADKHGHHLDIYIVSSLHGCVFAWRQSK
ncbi:hypothetical protein KI387_002987, partial [Taxus chinensis]